MDAFVIIVLVLISILSCLSYFIIQKGMNIIELLLTDIIHQNKEIISSSKKNPAVVVKKPGANRTPRSEEEKAKASQKRKEWWEKKRAQDALKEPQEPAL